MISIVPSPSPEEAAAIVAAIVRFRVDTAPRRRAAQTPDGWLRAARLHAVGGAEQQPAAWGEPHPWVRSRSNN